MTTVDLQKLAAEFPRSQVSWRAQSVSNKDANNPKALALAYIDARDVMHRLDAVCGAGGWQCRYPHADKKTVCEIGIKIDGEWVWKANGAGDSDIEAEKGALSDAFKRAAVLWGIGRYLYDIPSPWVPCKLYNSKWSDWVGDPWAHVRGLKPEAAPVAGIPATAPAPVPTIEERLAKAKQLVAAAKDAEALTKLTSTQNYRNLLADLDGTGGKADIMNLVTERYGALPPAIRGAENVGV